MEFGDSLRVFTGKYLGKVEWLRDII